MVHVATTIEDEEDEKDEKKGEEEDEEGEKEEGQILQPRLQPTSYQRLTVPALLCAPLPRRHSCPARSCVSEF